MASHNTRGSKKKRSFLYKARKFGRRGQFGRGKNVEEETYNYFVRVMERLNEEFEDEEEKEIFITNVFEQTNEKEMDLMCNQVISKVIEKLLSLAQPDILEKFAKIIQKEMRIICTDAYASHVLEKVMHICLETVSNKKHSEEHQLFCKDWLCAVFRYSFNNVEDFIADIYASHILRSSLQCASGVDVSVMTMKSHRSRRHLDDDKAALAQYESKEFAEIIKDFGERFIAWPQLHDFVHSDDSSAVIQTVLYCLHNAAPKLCERLVKVLVDDILPTIPSVWDSASTVHILEACLSVSDDETVKKLCSSYFKGHLKSLAETHETKFSVVKLLEAIRDKELFAEIFEELAPNMEDIFASGSGTVVSALANACRRLSALQANFLQHLMQTFHCFDPESRQTKIVPLVSRLITFEIATENKGEEAQKQQSFPVHYIGSQIVQTLLNFAKPIKIVQSLLEMDSSELRDLMVDPSGSHIMDAFVSAEFVGEKSREKLVHKLQGSYFTLATSKNGSRALDALWRSSDTKARQIIADELIQKEAALLSNMFGRIIFENYALSLLKHQKADWKSKQDQESKKRKLFANLVEPIIPDESGSSERKRIKKEKKKTK